MSYTLCPICGQRNDITGHTCWVQTIAPTAWNNHIDIRTDNTAVIRALEKRVAELETLLRAEQGYTELNEARIAELEAENQRLCDGVGNAMLCDSVVQMHECLAALLRGGE